MRVRFAGSRLAARAVVAGRASVLAHGERGVLADALERQVPLPQSPAVRTGLLTNRALALLLQGEGAGAATLLELCAEGGCPGELPLPTLRAAEARLVAGNAPAGASAGGRASGTRGAAGRRGRSHDGAPGELAAALMPTARARLAVAEGDSVVAGDLVAVLEAMKMEQPMTAHKDGTVSGVNATVGETVAAGHVLLTIAD